MEGTEQVGMAVLLWDLKFSRNKIPYQQAW